ncbi:MAG TPA: deoxyribonuclease IV [Actinomycetota bacterium]|nr:deoxyribonuclease IV [Actinomycetota bacterium]
MRIGAHVPTRGASAATIQRALDSGCEAIQLFISNPRAWAPPPVRPEAAEGFIAARRRAGIGPVVVHTSYMVNIASPNEVFRGKSVALARLELDAASAIEADGLIVHAGAGGVGERDAAVSAAADSVRRVLGDREGPPVVLELTAGGTGTVASRLEEAAELFDALAGDPRVLLCLDTCHLFASGYPLDEPGGVRATFSQLDELGLGERLRVVHANDAKDPRGSRRDRHEHVGQGYIGREGFRAILSEPVLDGCALLVETPGKLEDDIRNLTTLRELAPTR